MAFDPLDFLASASSWVEYKAWALQQVCQGCGAKASERSRDAEGKLIGVWVTETECFECWQKRKGRRSVMIIETETSKLIERWEEAQTSLENARRSVNHADCALVNATTALVRKLLPDDAKSGEVFAIWCGPRLFEVTCTTSGVTKDGRLRVRG